MRVVLISDTHGFHRQVDIPPGDLLIFAGDYTARDSFRELSDFADWFSCQPCSHKIFVPGNHDWIFERAENEARKAFHKVAAQYQEKIHILIEEEIEIAGLKIYGSPWQPFFCDWAFNATRGPELKEIWSHIPDDTDILITHGPPYGINDQVMGGKRVGCEDLARRIKQLDSLKLHHYGHLHESYEHQVVDGVHHVNSSICDFFYEPKNKPIVIDI